MIRPQKNCTLKENCHQILIALGYRSQKRRKFIIDEIQNSFSLSDSSLVLTIIKSWDVKKFLINLRNQPYILKQIANIDLSRVETINVCGNAIQSMDGLSRVNFQNLKGFFIYKNKLRSIRQFKKVNWPFLEHIVISWNFVLDPQMQAFLPDKVQSLQMSSDDGFGSFQRDSHRWMGKIESPNLKYLVFNLRNTKSKIIMGKKMVNTMLRRYPKLLIEQDQI